MEKQFRVCFDIFMNHCFAFLIENTDVHFSGMQIDAAVILALVRTYNHYGCDVCSKYWDDFASEDSKCHEPGHTIKKDTFQRNVCPYCDNAE